MDNLQHPSEGVKVPAGQNAALQAFADSVLPPQLTPEHCREIIDYGNLIEELCVLDPKHALNSAQVVNGLIRIQIRNAKEKAKKPDPRLAEHGWKLIKGKS